MTLPTLKSWARRQQPVFSRSPATWRIMTQVDLIVELLHHPLLCLAVLVIDSILPILLSWFVCLRPVFVVDGH